MEVSCYTAPNTTLHLTLSLYENYALKPHIMSALVFVLIPKYAYEHEKKCRLTPLNSHFDFFFLHRRSNRVKVVWNVCSIRFDRVQVSHIYFEKKWLKHSARTVAANRASSISTTNIRLAIDNDATNQTTDEWKNNKSIVHDMAKVNLANLLPECTPRFVFKAFKQNRR